MKVEPPTNDTANDITTLVADASFNWETSSIVQIHVQTLDNSGNPIPNVKLSVFTDYTYLDGKEILSGNTNEQGVFEVNYRITTALDSLVLSADYLGLAQNVKVPVTDNQLNYIFGGVPGVRDDDETSSIVKSTEALPYTLNYLGSWSRDGTPRYLENTGDDITAEFLVDINTALPENQPVPDYHPEYLYEIYEQNINLIADAEVWITFVSEGADYLNTLAYYTFDKNNPPQSIDDISEVTVIFPNVSFKGSGGGLYSGDKVYLGQFPAGTSLGWLLITDAYDTRSRSVTDGIDQFFSHKVLNPETESTNQQHVVLLKDVSRDIFLISFEDLVRPGGDQDFNDAVFYATVDPISAVEEGFFPTLGVVVYDTDNDGVPDNLDEFPEDPQAAFNSYYPQIDSYASLVFEDLWPAKGDYDFNDLVLDYNFNTITNIYNEVIRLEGEFLVRAIGAGFHNGFGFELENISSDQVASVSGNALEEGYIQLNANGTESGQTNATIIVFDDAWNHGSGNTDPTKDFIEPRDRIRLTVTFTNPIPLDQFDTAPFNPFLIINGIRGREVHLPDYSPTDLIDLSYFKEYNDDSDPASGRYFKTIDNLPWVLNIPSQFKYPIEKNSINHAHLKFIPWVESSGTLYNDWYLNLTDYRDNTYIY